MPFTVDPIRKYENVNGICIVETAKLTTTVNNNWEIVPALADYRVRVMGWIIQSDGATLGTFTLKSNSGGSAISTPITVPASTGGLSDKLRIQDVGYMETAIGHGLFADVVTAGVLFNIFYIRYKP